MYEYKYMHQPIHHDSRETYMLAVVRFLGWILVTALFVLTVILLGHLFLNSVGAVQVVSNSANVAALNVVPNSVVPNQASVSSPSGVASDRLDGHAQSITKAAVADMEKNTTQPVASSPSVADSISALSAAVAVMTLILSLGVPWFYDKIDAVRKIEVTANDAIERIGRTLQRGQSAQALNSLWVSAHSAVILWLDRHGGSTAATTQMVGLQLQALQSDDPGTRREAFAYLERLPWPEPLSLLSEEISTPLWRYQCACHRYHALGHEIPAQAVWTYTGLWCLFWDPVERRRFNYSDPPKILDLPNDEPSLPSC